jgi:uncharacterized membrane protein
MKSFKFLSIVFFVALLLSACTKRPDEFTITANKTTVSVDEEVTITISDPINYKTIDWVGNNSAGENSDVVSVAGGGTNDLTWTVRFTATGKYTIIALADNSKKENSGTHAWQETIEITVN